MVFGQFSTSQDLTPKVRTINCEAPLKFRNQLIDLAFYLANDAGLSEDHLYRVTVQNIGASVSGQPYGGYRYAVGRELGKADWVTVYDLIPRLGAEFRKIGRFDEFRENLNRILAGNGIVWDVDEVGGLVKALPPEGATSVRTALHEFSQPEFAAAYKLLLDAIDAYNSRPQRARDSCANAFDAVESAGKVVAQLPSGTFGDVIKELTKRQSLLPETLRALEALNVIRHNHFGHGGSEPFALAPHEVDFVYLSCVAAAVLFGRMPHGKPT